jgi:hypothetical protein
MTEVVKKGEDFFSDDFRELFMSMMSADPTARPSLAEIKKSRYYNGPTYDNKTVKELMRLQLAPRNPTNSRTSILQTSQGSRK